jgi:ATP-dependent 26S proteasome regulatory subunit
MLLVSNATIQCASQLNVNVEKDIEFSSMVGVKNNLIVGIIAFLKKTISDDDAKKPLGQFPETTFINRLLVHGVPGNGKSTLAQEIAKAADCEIITLRGSTVVEGVVNKGSENIEIAFARALNHSIERKRPVLIFIDEVDAIASSDKSEFRGEHRAAGQTLWMLLDTIQNDPRIFFMCATNTKDKLDQAVLDRFGARVIEMTNPSAEMREKIIKYYCKKFNISVDAILSSLVEKTDGLSIRAIKDIIREMIEEYRGCGVPLSIDRAYEIISITKNKFPAEEKKDNPIQRDGYDKAHLAIAGANLGVSGVNLAINIAKALSGS